METIITAIAAVAGIAFWVGLINPKLVFMPNRKRSSAIYFGVCLLAAIIGSMVAPVAPKAVADNKPQPAVTTADQTQPAAKPKEQLTTTIDFSEAANQLPPALSKALGKLNLIVKPVIYNKALVVAFNFDSIEELQATSAIQSVCLSYFNHGESNRAWKASLFDHIYVTNDILTKGYVFQGGESSCDIWGKKAGDSGDQYLSENLTRSRFVAINMK